MRADHLWERAKNVVIRTGPEITGGFDIGFDDKIPAQVREEITSFVRWVEGNFSIPVTLWVDLEYKHYLISRDKRHVGYLFYWADHKDYPEFLDKEDIPEIRLPVRTERWTIEEILTSFIEAISMYFYWILNEIDQFDSPDEDEVEEVLRAYLDSNGSESAS
ncbi:MAG: hypothetical protein IJW45_01620 [Oscillospiraceae bacterium]|nr:hypothetical protein [Oscillospiraceae bacterium]